MIFSMKLSLTLILAVSMQGVYAQDEVDTTVRPVALDTVVVIDTSIRIINLAPYFTQHVDSAFSYQFQINRSGSGYYWYLKNAPVGMWIHKESGLLQFKADKSFFMSGKLKYDHPYKVNIGVQSLGNPQDVADTSFSLLFYNTEIIPSRIRPSVSSNLTIDEGERIAFLVQCDNGSFPIEQITFSSNRTLQQVHMVKGCNEEFSWTPDFDFVKETDPGKEKLVQLNFIGSTRFGVRDTAVVRITVKNTLNYPLALEEHNQLRKHMEVYVLQLKWSFLQLDRRLKKNKSTRTSFDLTTAASSLSGTILNSSGSPGAQKAGKIVPSIGLSMVPIKEAVAPNKNVEQNQATLLRASIKRLEFMLGDNIAVGDRDPDLAKKTIKLREELKHVQVQLIDVPVEVSAGVTEEELNRYFNSRRVNKKYRLRG
jgi:hypothetical protein